jgi:hypothetical protein
MSYKAGIIINRVVFKTDKHCVYCEKCNSDLHASHFLLENLNLLKPTGHVMHQQFNIQQLYALPTLYLCVLYLSENKQRLVPLRA